MQAVANLKFCILMCYFVESILRLRQKCIEELRVITMKNDAKFEEELTCALKSDMRNLTNFNQKLEGLTIFFLMGSF